MQYSLSAYRPTVAEINLSHFNENIRNFKSSLNNSMLMAVVKTNAYGHGVVPIGHEAIRAGADRLGVTTIEEGVLLRESGITAPIHMLNTVTPEQAVDMVTYNLTASVSTKELAGALSDAAIKQQKTIPVHLKIDTGLHRFGIDPNVAVDFCQANYSLPGLAWEGIYTHFSNADEGDWELTERQFTLFKDTVEHLEKVGFTFPIHHVGASTIALERSDMHLDMVRPGIALFGYTPESRQERIISLKPVMRLKSSIMHVRTLPPDTAIGYGGSYVTKGTETIAIVPIGHGDGYSRALSNIGEVLVRGKRAKIVGTISLDQTFINVTDIPDVADGDEVVLIGRQRDDEITAREVAGRMDSIVDEVLSGLLERIRRVYV